MKNSFLKICNIKNTNPFIIAEVSGNHQGNFSKLKKLTAAIVKAKADAIKFQVYKPETITLNVKTKDFMVEKSSPWKSSKYLFDLYKKAYTPWDWISKLVKYLNKVNFPWFASVFDESALIFLEKLRCPAYKIASPEITDVNLISKIAKTRKPIILSTGVSNINDIDLAIKTIKKFHKKIVILKCVSEYPASYNELNLDDISIFKKKFRFPVGFSDHTIGGHAAMVASAIGATVFEKHFKLDNDYKSIDNHFSMPISKLKDYRHCINSGKEMIRSENKHYKKYIEKKKRMSNRSLYISKNIKKGETLTQYHVKSVRPGLSMHPKYLKYIVGKKTKLDLKIGSRIKLSYFS